MATFTAVVVFFVSWIVLGGLVFGDTNWDLNTGLIYVLGWSSTIPLIPGILAAATYVFMTRPNRRPMLPHVMKDSEQGSRNTPRMDQLQKPLQQREEPSTTSDSLIDALSQGDDGRLEQLLNTGGDPDVRIEGSGSTLLHRACDADNVAAVRILIRHGADPNAVNRHGVCPLHLACEKASDEVVEILLGAGAETEVAWEGKRPLHIAAQIGRADVAALLISRGADVNAAETDGATALHHAALAGALGVARCLLEAGADVNALGSYVERPPLSFAVLCAQTDADVAREMVSLLLSNGANPSVHGPVPIGPPLFLAVSEGQYDIAETMLQHWGDVNQTTVHGLTLLHWACEYGSFAEVRFALSHGADPNAVGDAGGWSALHHAVATHADELVCQELIDAGAAPNGVDQEGRTPLHVAAMYSNAAAGAVLIRCGADTATVDCKGQSPLDTVIVFELAFSRGLDVVRDFPDDKSARLRLMRLLGSHRAPIYNRELLQLVLDSSDHDVVEALRACC